MIIFPDSIINVGLPLTGGIIYGGITRGGPIAGSLIGDSTASGDAPAGPALLLEDGSGYLFLEDGTPLILE